MHLLLCTNANNTKTIGNFDINNARRENLFWVKFDQRLTFDDHISDLSKKISRKIHTLARVAPYMNLLKRGLLMNYCSPVWMCHGRKKIMIKLTDFTNVFANNSS